MTVHHVWATPDPDEYDRTEDTHAMVCSREAPYRPRDHIKLVFHPWMRVEGIDYVCDVCGERTHRRPA